MRRFQQEDLYCTPLSKSKETHKKKMRVFVRTVPRYEGNPEKVFQWYENLEAHLYDKEWETKKSLQEKDKEGQKQEYMARKQGRNEDPGNITRTK